jgi:hypothetical protein
VDLNTYIVKVFCVVDDAMKILFQDHKLRHRGSEPNLGDNEVITIVTLGEYLYMNQDKWIFKYFCTYFTHFFPALNQIHRTTFVRQAAYLWQAIKNMAIYNKIDYLFLLSNGYCLQPS